MTMQRLSLHHIVRVRRSEDLHYARPGLMDEILINANLLEHVPESTATALRQTTLPYSIDPLLTRFQRPEWWRNKKNGELKRNYARLGAAYVQGTSIRLAAGPLVHTVPSEKEWRILARNTVAYQRDRLVEIRPQMELFHGELRPRRLMAPALMAFGDTEDRVNRLLAEASAEATGGRVGLPVVIPGDRLRDPTERDALLRATPTECVSAYFIWTPGVTEELLLSDHTLLGGLIHLVTTLAGRGVAVGHLHGTYAIAALHDLGLSAVVHHMGWTDHGEPADETGGGPRSCQTYVPGVRRCLRFPKARELGRHLDASSYAERFCSCALCTGFFEAGQHPLDLLLEDEVVHLPGAGDRPTPTGRAAGLNTWHYLLSRRQEIEAFSSSPAVDVLARDIERAASLAGGEEPARLQRLADGLRSA